MGHSPVGFLVVRSVEFSRPDEAESLRSRYHGVDRVPPYPSDDEGEQDALDQYVFGNYKDGATNLIPSYAAALRLQRLFLSSKHRYEILFCCKGPEAVKNLEQGNVDIEHLGYDVAAVRGDYWSIVDDFSRNEWASEFRRKLNPFGLFPQRTDAEEYLREYRDRREPDSDSPFDVLYVVRVLVQREPKDDDTVTHLRAPLSKSKRK